MEISTALLFLLILYGIYRLLDRLVRIPFVDSLDQKHILVTGCDSGFGRALVRKLDNLGCPVFAGCFTETGETHLKKSCSKKLRSFHLDVTSSDSVRKAFVFVKNCLPPGKGLHGIVNNAGIAGKGGPATWLSLKDYKDAMDVNIFGVIDVTVTFLPLVKQATGRVVNIASVYGRLGMPSVSPYTLSKFCVEAFSDCIRRELKPFDVSVHILEPGFFKTNMTDTNSRKTFVKQSWDEAPGSAREEYGQEYFEKAYGALDEMVTSVLNEDISGVVDAYTHALLGRFPRGRYVIGKDAQLYWIPISWLPEWLSDLILWKHGQNKLIPLAVQNKHKK